MVSIHLILHNHLSTRTVGHALGYLLLVRWRVGLRGILINMIIKIWTVGCLTLNFYAILGCVTIDYRVGCFKMFQSRS